MKNKIIDALISIGAVKFGEYKLKSGIISPIYLDLRILISFPELLKDIASLLTQPASSLQFDRIAGIPYTALPIATAFSLESGVPMVYCRKEKKEYGTAQQIEGVWKEGETVLIIDDLITNGESKTETFTVYESAGLVVKDVIVLIDREQGGKERLEEQGYKLHALISIFEIIDRLKNLKQISESKYLEITRFLSESFK